MYLWSLLSSCRAALKQKWDEKKECTRRCALVLQSICASVKEKQVTHTRPEQHHKRPHARPPPLHSRTIEGGTTKVRTTSHARVCGRAQVAKRSPNLVPCFNLVLSSVELPAHAFRALENCRHAGEGLPCCPVTSSGTSGAANGRAGEQYQVKARYQVRANALLTLKKGTVSRSPYSEG